MSSMIAVLPVDLETPRWTQPNLDISKTIREPYEVTTIFRVGLERQVRAMKWCQTKCPKIPIVRKCCCFVPIRKGVIIFGYVNLVLTLLVFPFFLFLLVEEATKDGDSEELPPRMDPIVHLPLTLAFLLTDVVMYIVLLVGAHKRNQGLLKGYLYFGLTFQLVTLCVDLVFLEYEEYLENAVYFFFLGLNVYLLFLVYNTVRVIEESSVQYVAHQDRRQLILRHQV